MMRGQMLPRIRQIHIDGAQKSSMTSAARIQNPDLGKLSNFKSSAGNPSEAKNRFAWNDVEQSSARSFFLKMKSISCRGACVRKDVPEFVCKLDENFPRSEAVQIIFNWYQSMRQFIQIIDSAWKNAKPQDLSDLRYSWALFNP